jgi:hypothetical protein
MPVYTVVCRMNGISETLSIILSTTELIERGVTSDIKGDNTTKVDIL